MLCAGYCGTGLTSFFAAEPKEFAAEHKEFDTAKDSLQARVEGVRQCLKGAADDAKASLNDVADGVRSLAEKLEEHHELANIDQIVTDLEQGVKKVTDLNEQHEQKLKRMVDQCTDLECALMEEHPQDKIKDLLQKQIDTLDFWKSEQKRVMLDQVEQVIAGAKTQAIKSLTRIEGGREDTSLKQAATEALKDMEAWQQQLNFEKEQTSPFHSMVVQAATHACEKIRGSGGCLSQPYRC